MLQTASKNFNSFIFFSTQNGNWKRRYFAPTHYSSFLRYFAILIASKPFNLSTSDNKIYTIFPIHNVTVHKVFPEYRSGYWSKPKNQNIEASCTKKGSFQGPISRQIPPMSWCAKNPGNFTSFENQVYNTTMY